MQILVDSLYIGSIWTATPEVKWEKGKTSNVTYSVKKCSGPFIIRMEEEHAGGRLVANIPTLENTYQLRPTSCFHESTFVNCEDVISLREYLSNVKLPKYIDSSKVEEIERTYGDLKEIQSKYEYDGKYLQRSLAAKVRDIIK